MWFLMNYDCKSVSCFNWLKLSICSYQLSHLANCSLLVIYSLIRQSVLGVTHYLCNALRNIITFVVTK